MSLPPQTQQEDETRGWQMPSFVSNDDCAQMENSLIVIQLLDVHVHRF